MALSEQQPVKLPWQEVAGAKCATRDKIVAAHLKSLSDKDADGRTITEIDDTPTLLELMQTGEVTASAVTQAYISRACYVQLKTNSLTEVCFDEALEDARRLDDHRQRTGELFGPLHGIPISVKDQFDVRGYDSTIGYVGRANVPATTDAEVVRALRSLGAVVIAKTNLPQSIMWCETENPLWGLTTHPLNPALTPGGSSGGEGALLSLHGSLIGWGTDIGGSVRIPSHMNGLWGLKPSSGRLSYHGVPVSTEGQQHVPSVVGPLARSCDSLVAVTQAVIGTEPWVQDPQCVPLPWRSEVFEAASKRKLTIGLIEDDGVVRVHPPVARVLKDMVAKLECDGHEIVPWDSSLHGSCIEIMDAYYTADGGEDIKTAIEQGGEPYVPHVEALVNRGKAISVFDYWQLNRRKIAAQKSYSDLWNKTRSAAGRPVDVLLMPTMPHSAVRHRCCRWVGYTKVWNLLDYTALSFPAGQVDKLVDDVPVSDYTPRNDIDAWNWKQYNVEEMHGCPIGLQIVGRRLQEEVILGVAKQFDAIMRR